MARVAVLDDYQSVAQSLADWDSLDAEVTFFHDHVAGVDAVAERLREFDVVVAMRERTGFPRAQLERLPNLRLLVSTGHKNAAIDLAAAADAGIVVTGTGGITQSTSELTWGLILSVLRSIPQEDAAVRGGGWQIGLGEGLEGRTLGVVGLGNIGRRIAEVAQAFRMEVLAWSEHLTAARAAEAGATRVERDELLARSDLVTIHLVLSDRTRGLIGERELGLMKPTAYLINTSRGPIVDEAALVRALESRTIAGAGLDVFDEEPLPLDHPLRRLPNTVITPHIGYVVREGYEVFYRDAVERIRAFLAGEDVPPLGR